MKATILKSNFAKALNQVSRVVGTRTTLPVLSNLLISASKGKIKISATDLEVGITTSTIGKVEEEGELTLPARLLSDFIQNNQDESIEITTEGTVANLKSSHFEASIHGISAEEFPTVPESPKEYFVTIKKDLFLNSLKDVNIAPASDETRPVLAGIYFQFEGEHLILAATDSYRLAEKKISLASAVAEKKIIVPARTTNEVFRILSSDSAEEISISATDNQVSFKIDETLIVSRLIEGAFPPYNQIIPAAFKIKATAKLADLSSAVKMSSLFAKDSANNNVKIFIKDKQLTIASAASQAGSSKSQVEAEIEGDAIEIAFNARYILDVLAVLSDDQVTLNFNDNTSAGAITTKKDKDFVYIIMPLKLEN